MPDSNQKTDLQTGILPDFSKASVLVVGDIMLDRYWSGDTSRISPEAPIPVVKVEDTQDRVGGAGNVALNIASLGASTTLLAITGQDEASQILQGKLEAAEVRCQLVKHLSKPTITKLRVMSRHQQMIRLDFEQDMADDSSQEALYQAFAELLENQHFDAVVFSDYAKGTLQGVQALIALANKKGLKTLVDPKGNDFTHYQGATVITPNRMEFEAVAGVCIDEKAMEKAALAMIKQCQLEALLVTRSEAGMTLFSADKSASPSLHFSAEATEVFDVTGAGDTVIATLAASLSAGSSFSDAVQLANSAAGIVVGKSGTAAIALHELQDKLNKGNSSGIVPLKHLKTLVKAAQGNKEVIVMTNGCFDIIHAGHIAYLEEARRLGNKLIVAVNSDASVKRLKGEARPINPLERRMQVLAGLKAVDWVVSFSEDTPAELVAEILPDILVKGGDWNIEEIAGGEAVVANGGKVMALSFKEGHSTTAIIDLIKEREQHT